MPQGVASHFMDILAADQKAARAKMGLLLVLAIALAPLAWLLAGWPGVATHGAALFVGVLTGVLVGRSRMRRFEGSIRTTWTQWMRYAVAAESVPEIHRKVRGKPSRNLPYLYAAVLFVVWGLEVTLLVLALSTENRTAEAALMAAPVIALNGLLAGGMLGYFAKMGAWYGSFRRSVSELVDTGEIGMWGVM